jgi:hypothetical protein
LLQGDRKQLSQAIGEIIKDYESGRPSFSDKSLFKSAWQEIMQAAAKCNEILVSIPLKSRLIVFN